MIVDNTVGSWVFCVIYLAIPHRDSCLKVDLSTYEAINSNRVLSVVKDTACSFNVTNLVPWAKLTTEYVFSEFCFSAWCSIVCKEFHWTYQTGHGCLRGFICYVETSGACLWIGTYCFEQNYHRVFVIIWMIYGNYLKTSWCQINTITSMYFFNKLYGVLSLEHSMPPGWKSSDRIALEFDRRLDNTVADGSVNIQRYLANLKNVARLWHWITTYSNLIDKGPVLLSLLVLIAFAMWLA